MNAAKPSFPTYIVGIVFTCFGWVGHGSPKKEGFKACNGEQLVQSLHIECVGHDFLKFSLILFNQLGKKTLH